MLKLENNVSRTSLAYDPNGNLETVTNALGKTVTLVCDAANRVEKTTDPLLNDRLFAYDAQDNPVAVTDARNNVTTFVYDPLKRIIRRTNPSTPAQVRTYAYDGAGRLTGWVPPTVTNAFGKEFGGTWS